MNPLRETIIRKCRDSMEQKEKFFEDNADNILRLAEAMAEAFTKGGKLLVMGNGGSACDAQHVAVEFLHPIIEKRRSFPAIALTNDVATMTAIGNDKDFSMIFHDQIKLLGRAGDMALGISTSGKSANVIRGLKAAREMGMITIAFAGKDGGQMPQLSDHCFVVPTYSIHRIQETQETLLHIMWDMIHVILGEEDVI
ncbi:MAG: D-sedoheptulose-7-phosphate isomerase [Deltaproteobacteria bacterium]